MTHAPSRIPDVAPQPCGWPDGPAPCGPTEASEIHIEGRLVTSSVLVDVRRYGWTARVEGALVPGDGLCYLGLSLGGDRTPSRVAFTNAAGARRFTPPGDMIFVPAGQSLHAQTTPSRARIVCCLFRPGYVADLLKEDWSDAVLDASLDLRSASIRAGLLRLAHEALSPGFASDILADAQAATMIVDLARHFRAVRVGEVERQGRLAPWQMRAIRQRVESGDAPVTLAKLAEACRISTRHLTRSFRASMGITLGHYVAESRMRRARILLAGREARVKEIALACGFRSQAAFAAAFRRQTGLTPRQYRQEHGEGT